MVPMNCSKTLFNQFLGWLLRDFVVVFFLVKIRTKLKEKDFPSLPFLILKKFALIKLEENI